MPKITIAGQDRTQEILSFAEECHPALAKTKLRSIEDPGISPLTLNEAKDETTYLRCFTEKLKSRTGLKLLTSAPIRKPWNLIGNYFHFKEMGLQTELLIQEQTTFNEAIQHALQIQHEEFENRIAALERQLKDQENDKS